MIIVGIATVSVAVAATTTTADAIIVSMAIVATATEAADIVICTNAIIIIIVVVWIIDAVVIRMIGIGDAISIKSTKEITAKSSLFLNMFVWWQFTI